MGEFQFDLLDEFDIFANPHGTNQSEADTENERKIYTYKKHPDCRATFAAGSSAVDHYLCYVGALPYIVIRNYALGAQMDQFEDDKSGSISMASSVQRIFLDTQQPTAMRVLDYSKLGLD